jgi:hypothetical protein
VDVCSLATENFLSKVDTSKNGLIELDEFTAAIQSDPSILELVANTVFGGIFSSNHGADWPSASAHAAASSQSKVGSDRT